MKCWREEGKIRLKWAMLVMMGMAFLAVSPQLLTESMGIVFALVWLTMVFLSVYAVFHRKRELKRKKRLGRVFAFKKKLRTSKEARSRITVRLKA